MEAYNTPAYPVFEADQVLSQKELNQAISHLEEQDRITRKQLTGLGIVCGAALTFPNAHSVRISCGTAVTSLGFQINWDEKTLSAYREVEISEQFLNPDYIDEPYLDAIFKYRSQYEPIKSCVELLESNSSAEGKQDIPNGFFDDKVIILLLEMSLIDQKNCVTTNCDDKGKRMEFNIRPLLIPINDLTREKLIRVHSLPENYARLAFPRYNVLYNNLTTAANVLDGFRKVYDDNYLISISVAIAKIYQGFKMMSGIAAFPVLDNSKGEIESHVNAYKNGSNVQYLWDWISDIVQAYNEIIDFMEVNPALCCVDESMFPFHVVLGNDSDLSNRFRTPFIRTLDAAKKRQIKMRKLRLLFQRLEHIITGFRIDKTDRIKVTPSSYGNVDLSKKSIPFYYQDILGLNRKWHPALTAKNLNDSILSYHSDKIGYTGKNEVKNPLRYDIEPYNFFRIEGHTGRNYKEAIKELTVIKNTYNLPFRITAYNAVDFLNKEIDISRFEGRWDDLETDYDLARKRVYNITEFVINWMVGNKDKLIAETFFTEASINNFKNILSEMKKLLTENLKGYLPNHKDFQEVFMELNRIFVFHRFCLQAGKDKLSVFVEDLIDRLDDVKELFFDDPFTVIFEEAQLRWQKIYSDLFFSTFARKHPGLEHKAGVTKGGTFVVVYVDTSVFKTPPPPKGHKDLLAQVVEHKNSIGIDPKIKKQLETDIKFTGYRSQVIAKPKVEVIKKWEDESDKIADEVLKVAKFNFEAAHDPEVSRFLFENLKGALEFGFGKGNSNETFQQLIIADFFLPYICCSDGPVLELKFESKEIKIALEPLQFCLTDTEKHEVTVAGSNGGTFKGTGASLVTNVGSQYFLKVKPDMAPGIYNLQYEMDGESSNAIEFEVFAPAPVKWTADRMSDDLDTFVFTNSITENREYQIDFGDNSAVLITTQKTVTHSFDFAAKKQFTVIIQQRGTVCESSQTITVKITADFSSADFTNDFNTDQ
ncbi:hypothetical protein [Flavobacterium sp.]|uniref:hypothetical protein n=1 Tax=Flavobacterium sp. TaxID=239 RepID=UPI00286B6901|nr:hypothetical protein [Flavobacterium sp.]